MTQLATIESHDLAALAADLGAVADTGGDGNSIMPSLRVNTEAVDDNGKALPYGQFYVKGSGEPVYAETVTFRPLSHHYQWLHYDPEQEKLVNKTRIVKNFREEARDIKGGLKCGKPKYQEMLEMSEDRQQYFKQIKCVRQVRGLVSYTGKTAAGEEKTVENLPVIISMKGSNYSQFEDEFVKKIKGRNIFDYEAKLTTKRHKNGSVIWFTMHFEPNLTEPLPLTQDIVDTMIFISEMINDENAKVDAEYDKAVRNLALDEDALDALEGDLADDFEDA